MTDSGSTAGTAPTQGLLRGLLPAVVATVERLENDPGAPGAPSGQPVGSPLFPEEAAAIAGAAAARRRDFALVRRCAHDAFTALGLAAVPVVPRGDGPPFARRAPRWPAGVVGSLTHSGGYGAAAVARATDVRSLGIDAEVNVELRGRVASVVAGPSERDATDRLRSDVPWLAWDRLLFSAKESVFKAWFPVTERWLGFGDCVVDLALDRAANADHSARGTFTATLTTADDGPEQFPSRLQGTWCARPRGSRVFLATAVVLLATPRN